MMGVGLDVLPLMKRPVSFFENCLACIMLLINFAFSPTIKLDKIEDEREWKTALDFINLKLTLIRESVLDRVLWKLSKSTQIDIS